MLFWIVEPTSVNSMVPETTPTKTLASKRATNACTRHFKMRKRIRAMAATKVPINQPVLTS